MKKIRMLALAILILVIYAVGSYLYYLQPLERAYVLDKCTHFLRKKTELRVSENVFEEGAVDEVVPEGYLYKSLREVYREYTRDSGIIKTDIIKDDSVVGDSKRYKRELMIYNKRPLMDIFTGKKYTLVDINRVIISLELQEKKINDRNSEFTYMGEIRGDQVMRVYYSIDEDMHVWGEVWNSWDDKDKTYIDDMSITLKGLNSDHPVDIYEYGVNKSNPTGYEQKNIWCLHTDREYRSYSEDDEIQNGRKKTGVDWKAIHYVEMKASSGTIEEIYGDFDFTIKY